MSHVGQNCLAMTPHHPLGRESVGAEARPNQAFAFFDAPDSPLVVLLLEPEGFLSDEPPLDDLSPEVAFFSAAAAFLYDSLR